MRGYGKDENDDGDDDDDDDDDDAKPADAPITGLVGPFPPPLLYWNSTQALKRTK